MATHAETLLIFLAVMFSFFAGVSPDQAGINLLAWWNYFRK